MFGLRFSFVMVIEVVAIFVGALSGALLARRRRDYDVVGMAALAFAAGLGGSLSRDVLLQQGTPLALTRPSYLVTVASAIAVSWFWGHHLGTHTERAIVLLDALGLGWFAVAGTLRCITAGLGPASAVLLGIVGSVGGGIVRDVLSNQVPAVFRRGELYALASLAGAVALVTCRSLALPELVSAAIGIVIGSGVRLASLRFGWQSPEPKRPATEPGSP
ncbi:MAG: rane protein [Labilithrix sp.]|nr:rane protein [Labilithrix sp.]